MGGFECADHINRSGDRVNLLKETAHDVMVEADYIMLLDIGIKTVREGVCWSRVETRPFVFDFTEVQNRILVAKQLGIQQIWDLCHFGYPDDLIPTHPRFTERFVALCTAFAMFYRQWTDAPLFVVPINEISFLSWHSGDVRGTVPFAVNSGFDIKYHLCKAAIKGIVALREVDPDCRIILVEPLVMVHFEEGHDVADKDAIREHQFQAMDIIAGRMCPELGGCEDYLDILGFNYYYNNQWVHNRAALSWPDYEYKRLPLSNLLDMAYKRYGKPIVLTETGHFGDERAQWLYEVTGACIEAIHNGVDLRGLCIYPITDRPDWDNLSCYCQCGLADLDAYKNRVIDVPYLNAIQVCMHQVLKQSEEKKQLLDDTISIGSVLIRWTK